MADRVAVFNDGRVQQIGTPQEIYTRPQSRFVADFVGSSNVLPPDFVAPIAGERRWASLRPETVKVRAVSGATGALTGTVLSKSYLGPFVRLHVDLGVVQIHAAIPASEPSPGEGERAEVSFDRGALHLMEPA